MPSGADLNQEKAVNSRNGYNPPYTEERTVRGLHQFLIRKLSVQEIQGPSLDLGCGTGAWVCRLVEAGSCEVYGVDRDPPTWQQEAVLFSKEDLDSSCWALPEQYFRLITAIEVIEHLTNVGLFLDNVSRYMHTNGVFYLTTPNIHSLAARMKFFLKGDLRQFDRAGDPTHLFPLVLDTFPRLLRRYGLEVKEIWSYPEDGRVINARRSVNWITSLLRLVLSERIGGDVLCMRIKKVASACDC